MTIIEKYKEFFEKNKRYPTIVEMHDLTTQEDLPAKVGKVTAILEVNLRMQAAALVYTHAPLIIKQNKKLFAKQATMIYNFSIGELTYKSEDDELN